MISLEQFYRAYQATGRPLPDGDQKKAIEEGPTQALFIVAGPGTGKTTCLALRILKLVFVDAIPPRVILATTFTKKAAAELRSRILGWGFAMQEILRADRTLAHLQQQISRLDINQVITGTIDSICEQVLRDFRDPGQQPPILIDEFVASTLMLREGLFGENRYQSAELDRYLFDVSGRSSRYGWHVGAKTSLLASIWDRIAQDQVDWGRFLESGPANGREGRRLVGATTSAYNKALADRQMVDFTLLEQEVYRRLNLGLLGDFRDQIQVILVDEYQDTNLLQESLYFELGKGCKGAITVVGDDDQSLYRFRGATVELFTEYPRRLKRTLGVTPSPVFLKTNYRSTRTIVQFVNDYATLDKGYQQVRVAKKPKLVHGPGAEEGCPVLGMFREDVDELATDLAGFLRRVFRGNGVHVAGRLLRADPAGGDLGDCALLCSSPQDYNASGNPRLPLLLKQQLSAGSPAIQVFNPRGEDLTDVNLIRIFGGLLLECMDPGGDVQQKTRGLSDDTRAAFQIWRGAAIAWVESAECPRGLKEFAIAWAERDPGRKGWAWPKSVSAIDLVYALVHFFPQLYDDPEGQIYLEVFTRQLEACEQVGSFEGRVVHDPDAKADHRGVTLAERSVMELLRNFLGPIASGTSKVNEELVQSFPRNRLSILSIHQAKGLEFPLAIVDVGSDFRSNHQAHAFKRFPEGGGQTEALEDLLRPYTTMGAPARSAKDRAFDDLYRHFFVAYSRPQEILLLVGLRTILPGGGVATVACGYDRKSRNHWATPPLVEI